MHVYLYTYVIHCWNGCTHIFYNCVIFVILNLKKNFLKKEEEKSKHLLFISKLFLLSKNNYVSIRCTMPLKVVNFVVSDKTGENVSK